MKFVWLTSTRTAKFVVAVVTAFLFAAGCATIGSLEEEKLETAAFAALPADRNTYMYVNASSGNEFLKLGASLLGADSRQVEGAIENLDLIYLALDYVSPNNPGPGGAGWTCIGTGSFPAGLYASALNLDRDWKRISGSGRYWISADANFEIALPGRQMVVAGSSGVRSVVRKLTGQDVEVDAPAGVAAAHMPGPPADHPAMVVYELISRRPGLGFAAYLREPSALLPLDLPPRLSEGVVATATGDFKDEIIEAELGLRFPSGAQARIAGVLIKTLVISELRKGNNRAIDLMEIAVEDDTVSISPLLIPFQDALMLLAPAAAGTGGSR